MVDLSYIGEPNILLKYNLKNKLINEAAVNRILISYGVNHVIHDIKLFQLAMTHKSYCIHKNENEDHTSNVIQESVEGFNYKQILKAINDKTVVELRETNYEREEFRGDFLWYVIVGDYACERYPEEPEGFLTEFRTKIIMGATLAKLCKKVGLQKYALMSSHVESIGGRNNTNILEDVMEAFVGALYRDCCVIGKGYAFEVVYDFIVNVIEKNVPFGKMIRTISNYKNVLLQYYQTKKWGTPRYEQRCVTGPSHNQIFTMEVLDAYNNTIGIGNGRSKKSAEQEASKEALIYLRALPKEREIEISL
jgi:ribonuclease-3